MTNKKKIALKIFFVVIFIFVSCFSLYLLKNKNEHYLISKRPLVTKELSSKFRSLDKDLLIQDGGRQMWWNNSDGYSLIASTSESVLFIRNISENGQPLEPREIASVIFKNELTVSKTVFTDRGFTLNTNNSSTSTDDQSFYDYVQAYEKGDYLCTVTVSMDISSYPGSGQKGKPEMGYQLDVRCTDKLAESQTEQIPFLDALDLKNKEQFATLTASEGDYFRVETGGRRSGQSAILKKEGNKYRVLVISQDPLYCNFIKKEKIPESIAAGTGDGGCFADDGSTYIQGIYGPFSYSTIGVAVSLSQNTNPFGFTANQLKSFAEECGTKREAGYFDRLVSKFNGATQTVYNFKYQGSGQGDGIFMVTLLPNKVGYTSLKQFKKDFDQCAVAGDAYPWLVNSNWLLFVSSCGSGAGDDSGRPHGCDEIEKVVEPSLKLN